MRAMKLSVKDSLEQVYVMTDGEDKIITYKEKEVSFTEAEKWNQRSERKRKYGYEWKIQQYQSSIFLTWMEPSQYRRQIWEAAARRH